MRTIAAAVAALREATSRMRFDEGRERAFVQRFSNEREKRFLVNAVIGTVLSTACCAWDFVLLPDIPMAVLAVRALFLAAFVAMTLANRRLGPGGREIGWTAMTVLASLLVTLLTQASHAPHRFAYCFIEVQMVLFTVTVMGLRLRYAATAIATTSAINFANVWLGNITATDQRVAVECFFVLGGALALLHAFHAEAGDRRTFVAEERRRAMSEQLERMTRIDPMTGLFNRRHLEETTRAVWAKGRGAAMILLDVDRFKLFNDTVGHSEGDECLRRIGAAIAGVASLEGLAFRFGGEEFLVFLPGMDMRNALMVAEAVRQAIEDEAIPHPGLEGGGIVTASLGVATARTCDVLPAGLIKRADEALYAAKDAGRNRVAAHGSCRPERVQEDVDLILSTG